MSKLNTHAAIAAALLAAIAVFAVAAQPARQPGKPDRQPARQPSDEPPGHRPDGPGAPDIAGRLVAGLQNTPGCLGVDAGRFMSGKQAILAWFENKAAVVDWYNSPAHQQMLARFGVDQADTGDPLEHVTDEETPILVIAALTPAKPDGGPRPRNGGPGGMPLSQISIELYAPLPGGAFIKERLAPEAFKVPHMQDYTRPAQEEDPRQAPDEQPSNRPNP